LHKHNESLRQTGPREFSLAHKHTGLNVVENCEIKITLEYHIIYTTIYVYAVTDDAARRGQRYINGRVFIELNCVRCRTTQGRICDN